MLSSFNFIKEIHSVGLGFSGEEDCRGGGGGNNGDIREDIISTNTSLPSIKKSLKPWWYPDDVMEKYPIPTIIKTTTITVITEIFDDGLFGEDTLFDCEIEKKINYSHLLLEYLYYYCYIHSEGSFREENFSILSTSTLNPSFSNIRLIEAKIVEVRDIYFSLNRKKECLIDLKTLLIGPFSNIIISLQHLSQILNLAPYNSIIQSIIDEGIDQSMLDLHINDCICIIEEYDRRNVEEEEDFIEKCTQFLNNN